MKHVGLSYPSRLFAGLFLISFILSYPTQLLAQIALRQIVSGLSTPVQVTNAGDGSKRLFIVEQSGRVRILRHGKLLPRDFINLKRRISTGGERGLLSIAFHPRYKLNGKFYVDYTDLFGDTSVAEYRRSSTSSNRADTSSFRKILHVTQPFSNHNGGLLLFGPDRKLYVGLGDGGGAGDPLGNGQALNTLLGKIIRIDIDHGRRYSIPTGNPFAHVAGAKPEIWAYGLRNPWRFSFDFSTRRLFAGDVGQNSVEEVDIVRAGNNYGWNIQEGSQCYAPPSGCDTTGLEQPIAEYSHSEGEAVTGGYIYRGTAIPALQGQYIFGDFASGTIWKLQRQDDGSWSRSQLLSSGLAISSFGEDESKELYVVDYSGSVYKIIAST